jgi:hypothetical protein
MYQLQKLVEKFQVVCKAGDAWILLFELKHARGEIDVNSTVPSMVFRRSKVLKCPGDCALEGTCIEPPFPSVSVSESEIASCEPV